MYNLCWFKLYLLFWSINSLCQNQLNPLDYCKRITLGSVLVLETLVDSCFYLIITKCHTYMYVNRFIQKYTDVIQIHVYFVETPISAQYRKHKIYNIFTVIYKHFVSDKNHCMLSMPINKLSMNAINCCKTTDIWQELIFKQINN